ncbi:hypothetical protein Dsin_009302 [Dipteronia sinensis]|uniref:Uncharacterized protein n=1 Tax=Dipteronia sinensis TaxID=43782 RepID=A0AAE0EBZ5_9ROSI|nr:hypothetical protein Dsin_009302 [Dipteronia sinensis]
MILGLPTASANTDDILIWHFDKGGTYSVRSGYKVGWDLEGSGERPESNLHVILNCPKLKQVRSSVPFISAQNWGDRASALDFLLFYSKHLNKKDLELLCVILWRCWWRRNQLIHHAGARCDEDIVEWSGNFLAEWSKANERIPEQSTMIRRLVRILDGKVQRMACSKLIRMLLFAIPGTLSASVLLSIIMLEK